MVAYTVLDSPAGPLLVAGEGEALLHLEFGSKPRQGWVHKVGGFCEVARQLDLYFAGKLREFTLDLRPEGTPFQLAVWGELIRIPYGTTVSYGEIARRLGKPGASRAVGLANGANPIAIIIPCHRVIGAGGALTGFGGGLDVKRRLLALERGEAWLWPAS